MKTTVTLRIAFLVGCVFTRMFPVASQCHYVPSTSVTGDTVIYFFSGGSFESYGCAPIDPTFWLEGSGIFITASFLQTQSYPGIRVWGMNDDDTAAVTVNGASYPMTSVSATILPKVLCGISPGPDGSVFANGLIVGGNDNFEQNYSYTDIILNVPAVNSLKVEGIAGLGWGLGGVLVDCQVSSPTLETIPVQLFPNPTDGTVFIEGWNHSPAEVMVFNSLGEKVLVTTITGSELQIGSLPPGVYLIMIRSGNQQWLKSVVRI